MRVNMYTLKITEVSIMDKSKINLERLRAYDAEWEEDKHPRAKNGQFTSGSGSAGGSNESSVKSRYSAAVSEVRNQLTRWADRRDDAAANEAADVFLSELGDSDDVPSAAQAAREHLESVKEDIVDIDGDDRNWQDAMDKLNEIEERFGDWDSELYAEPKSPLRQAAETMQGKSTKAVPEFGSEKFHFDVSNYKTVVSGKDANTPEGEVHNSIIGMLETDNPTKYDIANAAFYLADEDYNDKVRHCREMIRKAKAQGKSKASQEWGEALIKANKQVTLLNAIGEAMRK